MKTDVLGVKINTDTKNTILFLIKKLLSEGQKVFIATPYSEMIVRAQKDAEFRNVLNSAGFALPDGVGILWAAHYLKYRNLISSLFSIIFNPKSIRDPIPEKISGADFVWDISRLAADRGYSIFLLGGFGNTPDLAAAALKNKFPNLKIAGIYSPPRERAMESSLELSPDEGRERPYSAGERSSGEVIVNKIKSASPEFLFVALGPVRQEKWIYNNLPNLPSVKLAVGLGGTFDYLAGKQPLAGQIWRSAGLEWLFRLLTQPWRIIRISKGVLGLIYYSMKSKV